MTDMCFSQPMHENFEPVKGHSFPEKKSMSPVTVELKVIDVPVVLEVVTPIAVLVVVM